MADNKQTAPQAQNELALAIGDAVRAAIAEVKPKEFDYSDYVLAWHNSDPARKLTRPVFQNGQPINIRGCSDDTVNHLNKLREGRYIGGRVTVQVKGDAPNETVHITYPWASVDDRMKNYALFSSFSDLVQKLSAEQKTRDEAK